jgi:hypothetical protein
MTEWHWETVTPLMRDIMHTVGQSDLGTRFYLAGGTALALHLGHRRSIDLGFFSMVYFDRAEQEAPVPLLQGVDWEVVKAFFREQALLLGRGWLS